MVFHLAIERARDLRTKAPVSFDEVWNSRFFRSYVAGYPASLDEQDDGTVGAITREYLMRAAFTHSQDEVRKLFSSICQEYEGGNEIVRKGYMLGADDGQHCFDALLKKELPPERAVFNLQLAVRGLDEFD